MYWCNYLKRLEHLRAIAHDIKVDQDIADMSRQRFRDYADDVELSSYKRMAELPNAEELLTKAIETAKQQAAGRMTEEVFPC